MESVKVTLVFGLVLFVCRGPTSVRGELKFGLELKYATSVVQVQDNHPNSSHSNDTYPKYNTDNSPSNATSVSKVCHLSDHDLHHLCEDAVKTYYCQRHEFMLIKDQPVQSEKIYTITYGGMYNYNIPPETVAACACPSLPPIYLKDGFVPGVVTVVIDGEKAIAMKNSTAELL